jgi:hypothetical protein
MTRRKLAGYQNVAMIIRKASPPNVLIGGPVPVLPGFPIEAFGNDGLSEVWEQRVTQQAVGNQTRRDESTNPKLETNSND